MHKSRVTNWNANKMKEQLCAILSAEQNKRLIDYAKGKIVEIGLDKDFYGEHAEVEKFIGYQLVLEG